MMKKIIVANLKMNLTLAEANSYLTNIKDKITDQLEVIICPSFPYLTLFKGYQFKLGAQNVFNLEKGSYTGEVSPVQLKSIGVEYVIVGHSERRLIFKEDNQFINEKIKAILNQNMLPILCVGETLEERSANKTSTVIQTQLEACLKDLNITNNIIMAYEPIWAIGSGQTPTSDEIREVMQFIKDYINNKYQINIRVLYGGSVNKDNIKSIIDIDNVDGVLIGGASIDSNNLLSMLNLVE